MLDIHFFANLRERLGCDSLRLEYDGEDCVADVQQALLTRGEPWQLLAAQDVLVAVNHTLCDFNQRVRDGDEIAFFPPVTGG